MTKRPKTHSWDRAAFAAIVRRHGPSAVGKKLGAPVRTVGHWADGTHAPSAAARASIAAVYGDAMGSPRVAPTPAREVASHVAGPDMPPPASTSLHGATAAERALAVSTATIASLTRELDRLDRDPDATARERASVATALTSGTRLLAKLSGALELTREQVLRSAHWRAIVECVTRALTPYPDALAAVAKALRDIEAP